MLISTYSVKQGRPQPGIAGAAHVPQSSGASMSTNSSQKQMIGRVVSREEWLAARKAHLKNEKALTRLRDLVAAERRALPWVKVDKEYVFDAAEGKRTLAE